MKLRLIAVTLVLATGCAEPGNINPPCPSDATCDPPTMASPPEGPFDAAYAPPPGDAWTGEVVRVSDGDTLRVDVVAVPRSLRDVLEVGTEHKLRLLRIDAPEVPHDGRRGDCLGDDAAVRLEQLAPPGARLLLAYDVERTDQYGRDLVHAWTQEGQAWINSVLLREGLARLVTFQPNDAYTEELREAEQQARVDREGVWDESRCPR